MKFTSLYKTHTEYQIVTLQSICSDKRTNKLVQAVPGLINNKACGSSVVGKSYIFRFVSEYKNLGYCSYVNCALDTRKNGTRVRYILVKRRIYLRN